MILVRKRVPFAKTFYAFIRTDYLLLPRYVKKCKQVYNRMILTAEQVKAVEEKTRHQLGLKLAESQLCDSLK